MEEGLDLFIQVLGDIELKGLIQILNLEFSTQLDLRGGRCGNNFISFDYNDEYDFSKPADFEMNNHKFEIFVSYIGSAPFNEAQYNEHLGLAKQLKRALEKYKCETAFTFSYKLPDGRDPNEIIES